MLSVTQLNEDWNPVAFVVGKALGSLRMTSNFQFDLHIATQWRGGGSFGGRRTGNLKAWWFATLFERNAKKHFFRYSICLPCLAPGFSHHIDVHSFLNAFCTMRKIIPAAFGYLHVAVLGVPGVSYMRMGTRFGFQCCVGRLTGVDGNSWWH